MDVPSGGLEERLLRLLLECGASSTADLRRRLRLPEARLAHLLKRLESRGMVAVERLPHAAFVSLRRSDLRFVGVKRGQKHPFRKSKGRRSPAPDPLYG
ncbi:MAG: hypothetical protein QXO51_03435 [Halobacteria archaeon]